MHVDGDLIGGVVAVVHSVAIDTRVGFLVQICLRGILLDKWEAMVDNGFGRRMWPHGAFLRRWDLGWKRGGPCRTEIGAFQIRHTQALRYP